MTQSTATAPPIRSRRAYAQLASYALRRWPALLAIVAITFASPLITAISPWPMKLLIDGALNPARQSSRLDHFLNFLHTPASPVALVVFAAVASLGLFFLASVLDSILTFAWTATGQAMAYDLASDLFATLQRLSLLFHNRRSVGDSLARLTGDSWCVYTLTEAILVAPIQYSFTLLTVGAIAFALDPMLTLASLAVAPAMAGAVVFVGPRLKRYAQLQRKTESQLSSFVHQTISAMPLVQAFDTQERNAAHFARLADGAAVLSQKSVVLKNIHAMFTGLVAASGAAVVIFLGARRVQSGAMTVGSLIVFIAYLRVMQSSFQGLLQINATFKSTEPRVERVMEILQSDDRVSERSNARDLSMAGKSLSVRFDSVVFGYDPDRPVLHAIDLQIAPGEVVALVGPTGAGKSTLAALVPRLFDPWSGAVLLNGQNLKDLTLRSVRRSVAVVPQEPFLLPLSVRENIAYADPTADFERVKKAAQAAGADEFIDNLPQGYDTILGERGCTLSAGQKQRLAIARALFKDAPILILDEPTAALDAATEKKIIDALPVLMRGRTCLVIAHRLSTIRHADRIVVLDHGRIVQQGTHRELLESDAGIYQQHYRAHHFAEAEPLA